MHFETFQKVIQHLEFTSRPNFVISSLTFLLTTVIFHTFLVKLKILLQNNGSNESILCIG